MITTGTTGLGSKPLTLGDVLAAAEKIRALPKSDQWIVIDPCGRMYQGTVEEVMRPLLSANPLLQPFRPFQQEIQEDKP